MLLPSSRTDSNIGFPNFMFTIHRANKTVVNVQPQARGMDRLFRLFREDQLICIRQALEDCDSPHTNGPRPLVFTNVRPEGFEFDRGHAPFFKLGFDVPDKVRRHKDLVSIYSSTLL